MARHIPQWLKAIATVMQDPNSIPSTLIVTPMPGNLMLLLTFTGFYSVDRAALVLTGFLLCTTQWVYDLDVSCHGVCQCLLWSVGWWTHPWHHGSSLLSRTHTYCILQWWFLSGSFSSCSHCKWLNTSVTCDCCSLTQSNFPPTHILIPRHESEEEIPAIFLPLQPEYLRSSKSCHGV